MRQGPSALLGCVLSLKRMFGSIPEASFLLIVHSGSVILLLLQTDSCEAGRSSLLPGLFMAAQGVHTSPEVTASCHTDGWMPFLPDGDCICGPVGWGLALCTGNTLTFLGQAQATRVQQSRRRIFPLVN